LISSKLSLIQQNMVREIGYKIIDKNFSHKDNFKIS
jgi:hypothetical protein